VHERWAFAHNGTVPRFDKVRDRLLAEIAPAHRALIKGQTDSEHLFRYALTLLEAGEVAGPRDAVARVVKDVVAMIREIAPDDPIGLNLMLTDGDLLAGTRLGRTLVYVARDGVYDCEICGFPHIHHDPRVEYRAVVVASEPITHEQWHEVPESSLWRINLDEPGLEISDLAI
jgi:predicted glutamine amidotransferase